MKRPSRMTVRNTKSSSETLRWTILMTLQQACSFFFPEGSTYKQKFSRWMPANIYGIMLQVWTIHLCQQNVKMGARWSMMNGSGHGSPPLLKLRGRRGHWTWCRIPLPNFSNAFQIVVHPYQVLSGSNGTLKFKRHRLSEYCDEKKVNFKDLGTICRSGMSLLYPWYRIRISDNDQFIIQRHV